MPLSVLGPLLADRIGWANHTDFPARGKASGLRTQERPVYEAAHKGSLEGQGLHFNSTNHGWGGGAHGAPGKEATGTDSEARHCYHVGLKSGCPPRALVFKAWSWCGTTGGGEPFKR